MTKRLIALLLAMVVCFGVLAGCGKDDDKIIDPTDASLDGATIDICVVPVEGLNHLTCYLTQVVQKKLNCTLKYNMLDEFGTVYAATQLSDGVAPDITYFSGYSATYEQYGMDGAYINVLDYLDQMPNVKAHLEAYPELLEVYTTEDGKLYTIPQKNIGGSAERLAYLYREDIFAKHDLTWPTNQAEFEQVLYKLKKEYPDSYPFVMRSLNNNPQGAQNWGYLWGSSFTSAGVYNTMFTLDENGNYYDGMISDAFKEMGQYLQWLKTEGLLDPSSFTHTAQTWYESMASNRSFITYDKVDRLSYINQMGKTTQGEEFSMVAGKPFNMGTYATTTTEVITAYQGAGSAGFLYIGYNNNLSATLKYVDWLFSEDGYVTCNWGIQGESYDVDENGNKYFLESFLNQYGTLLPTGLNFNTTGGNWDIEAFKGESSDKVIEALELSQSMGVGPRQYNLRYSKAERRIYDMYYKTYVEYARAEWLKMVIGQRSWDTWEDLKQTLKDKYHADDLLTIANSALQRIPYRE